MAFQNKQNREVNPGLSKKHKTLTGHLCRNPEYQIRRQVLTQAGGLGGDIEVKEWYQQPTATTYFRAMTMVF
jgi:hypothetical protein